MLRDTAGTSVLVAAVQWLQGALLGTVASTVAIIAIAATGMMMLSGRIDIRRGIRVVIGCFILFGASSIAAGIRGSVDDAVEPYDVAAVPMMEIPPIAESRPPVVPYDPYAGAAVPSE